ncbi:Protein CBG04036 [Caenorhabditis briggsae]|uniref:Protein CBG04036 n=1 Tax=Caenorhabditis briggsae TaxID=6238 RepID=A8WW20_CAEBR|nr:Protein CBG04036 [Caenorhabditis briggsae]CAP24829.2 Protein CBG04036 [Caenorhabditis briggsae]
MNVSFCLQKNRENGRKTKVGSKKPKFRKTLEEALLLYFQKVRSVQKIRIFNLIFTGYQKISIFQYVDWALQKNATENEEGKSSGTVGKFENECQRKSRFQTEVLSSRISKKIPVDNLCQRHTCKIPSRPAKARARAGPEEIFKARARPGRPGVKNSVFLSQILSSQYNFFHFFSYFGLFVCLIKKDRKNSKKNFLVEKNHIRFPLMCFLKISKLVK